MASITIDTEINSVTKATLTTLLNTFGNYTFTLSNLVDKSTGTVVSNNSYAANNTTYYDGLFTYLKISEGLRTTRYEDSSNNNTIGIGFNMDQWGSTFANREIYLKPILESIGVSNWENVYDGVESITENQAKELFHITMTGRKTDGVVAVDNWGDVTSVKLYNQLKGYGVSDTVSIAGTELATLFSLAFNNPGQLIGPKLSNAVATDDVPAAIYEILEGSNKFYNADGTTIDASHGIANRRLIEAATYKNDLNLTLPDSEFWQIVGWARKAISQGESPNGGSISTTSPLEIVVKGPMPDLILPTEPTPGKTNPDPGEDWNFFYAVRQADILTALTFDSNDKKFVIGSGNDETINGGANNDTIFGSGGNDIIDGGAGFDVLDYSQLGGTDFINADIFAGNTYLNLGEFDVPTGAPKDVFANIEKIIGTGNGDFIYQDSQNLSVEADGGADNIKIAGTEFSSADSIDGGTEKDTLTIIGSTVEGSDFQNVIGIDRIYFENDHTHVLEIFDDVVANSDNQHLEIDFSGAVSAGNTATLDASAVVSGGLTVIGGSDNDSFIAGSGNDILNGGHGNDTVTGGGGADIFAFEFESGAWDVITDYTLLIDKLDLNNETQITTEASSDGTGTLLHIPRPEAKSAWGNPKCHDRPQSPTNDNALQAIKRAS